MPSTPDKLAESSHLIEASEDPTGTCNRGVIRDAGHIVVLRQAAVSHSPRRIVNVHSVTSIRRIEVANRVHIYIFIVHPSALHGSMIEACHAREHIQVGWEHSETCGGGTWELRRAKRVACPVQPGAPQPQRDGGGPNGVVTADARLSVGNQEVRHVVATVRARVGVLNVTSMCCGCKHTKRVMCRAEDAVLLLGIVPFATITVAVHVSVHAVLVMCDAPRARRMLHASSRNSASVKCLLRLLQISSPGGDETSRRLR